MSAVTHENPVTQSGFTVIPNAVMLNPDLSCGAKLVYGYLKHLAWRNDDSAETDAPLTIICRDLHVSENTARGYVKELRDANLVRSKRRGLGLPNVYIVLEPVAIRSADSADQELQNQRFPLSSQDLEEEQTLSASPKKRAKREPNRVWDALEAVTGFTPASKSETSDFAKTVHELLAVIPKDAPREQVEQAMRARRAAFERHFEGARFTHRVLRGKWAELGALAVGGGQASVGAAFGLRELPEGETF